MGKVGNKEWEQGEGALSGWEVEGRGTSSGEYWASDVRRGIKRGFREKVKEEELPR